MSVKKLISGILLLISILVCSICFWYFEPIEEVMNCNSDMECKIITRRYGNFETTKTFQLNKNSILTLEEHLVVAGKRSVQTTGVYLAIINKGEVIKPFTYYICSNHNCCIGYTKCCYENFNKEKIIFEKYKKNPKIGFRLYSNASSKNFMMYCIFSFIIMFITWLRL